MSENEDSEDIEFNGTLNRLTSIVREQYKTNLSKVIRENYSNWSSLEYGTVKTPAQSYIDKWTELYEQKAVNACMIAQFYRKEMLKFVSHNPFGLDLAALNIQRGRDEALRTYNDYLEVSGHKKITNFHQFPSETARKLAEVYKHPDDIDLWVGGLLEPAYEDGVVGATFSDIIADQFSRFRHGDRYFYDNGPGINPGAFNKEQIEEIKKISMSRIICDNLDHISTNLIPPHAFLRPDLPGNAPEGCQSSNIPLSTLLLGKIGIDCYIK
uniref:Peroxidase n=1 Tax=Megaselia scalaris TaxID=36166 RepID=T1GAB9_MEGSC